MNKVVVIYKSKYGATKKYSNWIADELSCKILKNHNIKPDDLQQYDTIIYGGGIYAGGVNGIDLIIKNFNKLSNKKLILFTCGLADTADKQNTDSIKKSLAKVLTAEMLEKIKVFHLRGSIDYSKLSIIHKIMMSMLHKMLSKKDYNSLRKEDKEMLETYGKFVDFTNKSAISPIVEYVKE